MACQSLTVLFADLTDSTRLYQTQGDVRAHKTVSQSLQCMKRAIEKNGGKLLRTVGDAALASFENTDAACSAAIEIQQGHTALGLSVRVGFHVGEVISDSGDVYGNAVNLAARVAGFAEANEICITDVAVAKLSLTHRTNTHYLDSVMLKGVAEPMPVFRVHWQTDSAHTVIVTEVPGEQRNVSNSVLIIDVDGQKRIVDNNQPLISFGRAPENDVVIDFESASRNHATIELIRGRYVLSDSSTNGTYLLKHGADPEFVRRASVSLDHHGVIGLGFDPEDSSSHLIKYRIVSSTKA
ncbi:MAG: adenylate/guanylate cyclase domain-containing protein [Granulosicoccus sp.]